MIPHRKIAIVVGILFIIATAAPILSFPFINHMNAADFMTSISDHATQMTIGVLLELIMALAIAGIATTIYPILKQHNEALATGYVGIRIFEGVIFIVVAVVGLVSLLTLSQEFVRSGSPDSSYFHTLGTLLVNAHDWSYVISGQIVFSISALILNYLLYQSKLVPRFISVWGLLGALLILLGGLSEMFELFSDTSAAASLLFLPIALQEMFFAVWLIVKGFNPAVVAS